MTRPRTWSARSVANATSRTMPGVESPCVKPCGATTETRSADATDVPPLARLTHPLALGCVSRFFEPEVGLESIGTDLEIDLARRPSPAEATRIRPPPHRARRAG